MLAWVDRPARVRPDRGRRLRCRSRRRRRRHGRGRELLVRAAQLGGAGGGARRGARPRARRDLVRAPRRACDRAPARLAALRRGRGPAALRGGRGGRRGRRCVGLARRPLAGVPAPSSRRSSSTREASNPSIPSAGPLRRRPRRPGSGPTSSEPATSDPALAPPPSRIRATISCERRGLPVLDVHRDLDEPRRGQVEAERADAREAAAVLAHDRAAISRAASSGPRRFTLKAISGRRAPTITPPADGSSLDGPKSGASSPASSRRSQLVDAAAAVEGGAALGRRVEEDRQPERAEPLAERDARPPARARGRGLDRDDRARRRRRRSAGARRRAGAGRSARARPRRRRRSASTSSSLVTDEGEDGAVVVGVGVDVEEARVAGRARSPIASIVAGRGPRRSSAPTRAAARRRRCVGRVTYPEAMR